MSVVGPRPLTSADVRRLGWDTAEYDDSFAVPPGINGLAQLFAVPGVAPSAAMDRRYLRDASGLLDLQVVAAAFACNVFGDRRVKQALSRHDYAVLAAEAVRPQTVQT